VHSTGVNLANPSNQAEVQLFGMLNSINNIASKVVSLASQQKGGDAQQNANPETTQFLN